MESLWAVSFVTDSHTYALNSITLGLASFTTAPVTFTGDLYLGYAYSKTSLEPLDANTILTPRTASNLTFTSGYQILLPNTRYTAIFDSDSFAYVLTYGSWRATGPWNIAWPESTYDFSNYSGNGGESWGGVSPPLAFSVEATVVPEPYAAALILVGLTAFSIGKVRSVGFFGGKARMDKAAPALSLPMHALV